MTDLASGPIDLSGQVVIVTGAGRGFGRRYALEFARRGAAVVVNDLGSTMNGDGADANVAETVVDEIVGAGGRAVASAHTVATPDGAASIVELATTEFGRLDSVVNNAGILRTGAFEDIAADDWNQVLRVHLDGAFHVTQAAYRVMQRSGGGRFVFIASSAGLFGQPTVAHYAAAKAGTLGLANVVAIEGADHGILANTVLPFGESRMATETLGADAAAVRGFLDAISPDLVVPLARSLRALRARRRTRRSRLGRDGLLACSWGWPPAGPRRPARYRLRRTSLGISMRSSPRSRTPFRCRSSTSSPT